MKGYIRQCGIEIAQEGKLTVMLKLFVAKLPKKLISGLYHQFDAIVQKISPYSMTNKA